MSGRAGRRGLDKTGTVIIVADGEVPEVSCLKSLQSFPLVIIIAESSSLIALPPDYNSHAHAPGSADQAPIAIPSDLLDDPQLAASRSSQGRRDDQAQFL